MAIDTALGHILAVPEPSAVEQSLASFLRGLMQEQGSQAQKLASAIVGIAAAAAKDKGKVISSKPCSSLSLNWEARYVLYKP